MTVVEDTQSAYLVIFGGLESAESPSNALLIFTIEDPAALWVDATGRRDAPTARFGHGAAALNGRLFVYGGWTEVGGEPDQGLYMLDVASVSWQSLSNLPGGPAHGRAMFGMAVVRSANVYTCV
jgi:hypothetical protein